MGERHLILDFDGVMSARDPEQMAQEWGEVHVLTIRGHRITYAPELVETVERWARDDIQIVWLTTWGAHVHEFKALGMQEHRAIGVHDYDNSSALDPVWWKWAALKRYVAMLPVDARIVWCDDRMDKKSRTTQGITEFRLQHNVLSFCPSIEAGLTRHQVQRIERFLS